MFRVRFRPICRNNRTEFEPVIEKIDHFNASSSTIALSNADCSLNGNLINYVQVPFFRKFNSSILMTFMNHIYESALFLSRLS